MANHTGSCLCGAVKYELKGAPAFAGLCQCDHCQCQSGSAFLNLVVYPKSAITITQGELGSYTAVSDKGRKVERQFCSACGSPLLISPAKYPDICAVAGGTLDDRTLATPSFSFWCDRQPDWLTLPDDMTLFPTYPEELTL
ncbi:MAG TPA: GFA family protein [Sneathiellales bacterium]|nr:GFA family protein [Sneathiellales bacterium]